MTKTLFIVLLTSLVFATLGLAQQTVDQGKPGTKGSWPVVISGTVPGASSRVSGPDGGAVQTQTAAHVACTNTTMNVGTTGTACPASARADRSSIFIQLIQSGETLRITTDGTTTATSTAGAQISSGEAYTDNLAGTVAASCRCTAATCAVMIVECP